jgi:hypothetical protein
MCKYTPRAKYIVRIKRGKFWNLSEMEFCSIFGFVWVILVHFVNKH